MTSLISGAAGNLGVAVVGCFLEQGSKIHAACFSPEQSERLRDLFPVKELSVCVCNIGESSGAESWFSSSSECDAVVHLVGGIQAGKPIADTTDSMFDAMIDINARSTFYALRQAMRRMSKTGGSIVTVAARSAMRPEINKSVYSASKSAVIALTLAAAEEGKPLNIRANCIVPGVLRTPANLAWAEHGEENNWTLPEHAAQAIFALATAAGISGAVVPLYGKLPA